MRGDHIGMSIDELDSETDAVRYLHDWLAGWGLDHPDAGPPHPIGMVADLEERGWVIVRKDAR